MSSPISGFTAIPNPQMLAFMPIQSYLMMYFAGAGWQIGKRKVSAIPNDKFNPMSAKEFLEGFTADLRESIPVLEKSLQDITPLIRILIEQYGDFIKEALAALPQALQNIIGGGGEFSNIPTTSGTSTGLGPPTTASFLHFFKELADATKVKLPPDFLAKEEQTHEQRVALDKIREQSALRQIANLEAKRAAEVRFQARQLPPAIQPRGGVTQRPPGQSQRLERAKLQKEIRNFTISIKINEQARFRATGQNIQQLKSHITLLNKLMDERKQKLADLENRYSF